MYPLKNHKTKENEIKRFLEDNNIEFIHNKEIQNDCCLRYRPDFVIDCGSFYIVLEVDEFAHKRYDSDCEIIRMNNISSTLDLPCKFIRYNPDNSFAEDYTQNHLLEVLRYYTNLDYIDDLQSVYLFY